LDIAYAFSSDLELGQQVSAVCQSFAGPLLLTS